MIILDSYLTFIANGVYMQTLNAHTINPYIRTAIRSVLKAGTTIKQRIIFDYELLYVEKGEFLLRYDGSDYTCKEGQFLLIHPGISHSFHGIEQDLYQPHIHFDLIYTPNSIKTKICFQDKSQLSSNELLLIQKDLLVSDSPAPFVTFSNMEQTKTLFYRVIDQSSKNAFLSAKAALVELIGILITDNFLHYLTDEPQNAYDISQQIKDFVDSAHGSERVGFSSIYSFSRSFKKKYGFSPSKVNKT